MFEDKFEGLPRHFFTKIGDACLTLYSKRKHQQKGVSIVVYFPGKKRAFLSW